MYNQSVNIFNRVFILIIIFGTNAQGQILGGGGPIGSSQSESCISEQDKQLVNQLIQNYQQNNEINKQQGISEEPPELTFFPLAGRLWRDLFVFNYVDMDPTSGFNDWDCTSFTYNGHGGSDTDIRSFGEQIIGVPVFAAQDGVVMATHDGEDDMNTVWAGQPANFVIVDHGAGREGWYWHLKKNSVEVTIGQQVSAGTQLGLCASSGVSTGPHLHFEIRDDGVVHEPFTGACNPGDSGWVNQPPLDRSMYLHDFGITQLNINASGAWPNEWPRTGQIALSDSSVRVWWYGTALPTSSQWRIVFLRPNGSVAFNSGNQNFNNPFFWRWFNWWWTYNVPDMHTITGTWHVQLSINGTLLIEAPFEVVATRDPDFNRPPEPITVEFEPSDPRVGDVLSCLVNTSLTLDDPDFDIVRYHYVWKADNNIVRQVTSAAHSDTLPRNVLTEFSQIECTVVPNDGIEDGSGDTVSVTVNRMFVPTVSEWGMLVMTLCLLTVGTLLITNRQKSVI